MYNKEEAKQLRLDFWNDFAQYSKKLKELKPNRGRWIMYYTGIKGLELKFDIERYVIRVALELNYRREYHRLEVYEQLEKYKPVIDEIFGEGLIWDFDYTTASGNEVCRLYVEQEGGDFHKREQWQDMFVFMADNMIKIEKAFNAVKDFIVVPQP